MGSRKGQFSRLAPVVPAVYPNRKASSFSRADFAAGEISFLARICWAARSNLGAGFIGLASPIEVDAMEGTALFHRPIQYGARARRDVRRLSLGRPSRGPFDSRLHVFREVVSGKLLASFFTTPLVEFVPYNPTLRTDETPLAKLTKAKN